MTVGSLFSGYGGLDLAVGGNLAWWSDVSPSAITVMAARFPDARPLGDVKAVDWAGVPRVDVLTAGFPCQPFSQAGNWKGLDDDRHLWPYLADAIRHLAPQRIVLENVPGFVTVGLADAVGELAAMGYSSRWGVVSAADAGAPHQRERLFVIADADANGYGPWTDAGTVGSLDSRTGRHSPEQQRPRAQPGTGSARSGQWGDYSQAIGRWERVTGRPAPAGTVTHEGRERLNPALVEWLMGLPAGWVTDLGLPYDATLRLLGNGVVPQQAALAVAKLEAPLMVAA